MEIEDQGEDAALVYFEHDGKEFTAPGEPREVPGVERDGLPVYNYEARPQRGNGPDGNGRDRVIKTAKQLCECIVEVIKKLTAIDTLEWVTPVLPIPIDALKTLAQRKSLTSLSLELSTYRFNLHDRE